MGSIHMVGKATFANGDIIPYYDVDPFLDCIREELPHEATTGFRFCTITQEPAIRKAADDIVRDFFDVEEDDLAPSEEMQMGGM